MLTLLQQLTHTIENRIFTFACHSDAPLPHIKDALIKFLSVVTDAEEKQKAAASQPAETQAAPNNEATPSQAEPPKPE